MQNIENLSILKYNEYMNANQYSIIFSNPRSRIQINKDNLNEFFDLNIVELLKLINQVHKHNEKKCNTCNEILSNSYLKLTSRVKSQPLDCNIGYLITMFNNEYKDIKDKIIQNREKPLSQDMENLPLKKYSYSSNVKIMASKYIAFYKYFLEHKSIAELRNKFNNINDENLKTIVELLNKLLDTLERYGYEKVPKYKYLNKGQRTNITYVRIKPIVEDEEYERLI